MDTAGAQRWSQYPPRAPALRDSGLACLGAGQQAGRLPSTGRRTLSSHALVIVTNGSGFFRSADLDERIVAPVWFWLFPGVWHDYGPDESGWAEHWVLFEGVTTRAYASYGAWDRSRPVHTGSLAPGEPAACFRALRTATAGPSRHDQVVAAGLVHSLIGATVAAREPGEARSAVQAVIDAAAEPLSVAERATRAGLSPARLRAEVQAATGLTPHELVLRTRLARAQQLLAGTDLRVADIAAQIGYDDPAYFSRLFTRRVGTSPIGFRQQQHRR